MGWTHSGTQNCQYLHATLLILLIQLSCYKSMLKVTFVFFNFHKRLSSGNASLTNISFACSFSSLSSNVSTVGLLRVSGKVMHSSAAMKAFIPMMPNGSRRCTRFCGHGKIHFGDYTVSVADQELELIFVVEPSPSP